MDVIIKMITDNLSDDLLKKEYRITGNWLAGHCYVATEVLYHLMDDNMRNKYSPATLKINNITHWFLKEKNGNNIIDITKQQFDFPLDYTISTNRSFLTKTPSKRALVLINRIYEKNCY